MKKNSFIFSFIGLIFILNSQLYDNGTIRITDLTITEKDNDNTYKVWLDGKKLNSNYKNKNVQREIDFVKGDYPLLMTGYPLIDVMYAMAIKECELNIKDSVFVAGEKWNQAWTRDTSYSVILSLASIFNEISYNSLKTRVYNNKILQDTGTGGSFPISTDRVVWIIAGYNVAINSTNKAIYDEVYQISKNTMLQHIDLVFDKNLNLFKGEESFLDWREQTYPRWMNPSDIGNSYAFGTNVLHFKALELLRTMSKTLGKNEDFKIWDNYYNLLRDGLFKNMYSDKRGYFGAYLIKGYNKDFLYEGYETLGASLAVLWGLIDNNNKAIDVLNAIRPSKYGMPVVAPQLEGINPYHNDAIWPFVQSYRALAAAKINDIDLFAEEFYQVVRSAGMFLTFKENLVCSTGDKNGTAINSDRQLWSVSGFLGMVINGLAGINVTEKGIFFKPIKPIGFKAPINLTNYKYKNAILNVTVKGFGTIIESISVNGKKVALDYFLPEDSKGIFNIEILLRADSNKPIKKEYQFDSLEKIKVIENLNFKEDGKNKTISWSKKDGDNFSIFKNGEFLLDTQNNSYDIGLSLGVDEFFVTRKYERLPIIKGIQFLNVNKNFVIVMEAEAGVFTGGEVDTEIAQSGASATKNARLDDEFNRFSYNGTGYIKKWGRDESDFIEWRIKTKNEGYYILDFRFQNGGPINTGEKCSIKELEINGESNIYYFPHSGNWKEWIFSIPVKIYLKNGENILKLYNSKRTLSQKDVYPIINIDLVRLKKTLE